MPGPARPYDAPCSTADRPSPCSVPPSPPSSPLSALAARPAAAQVQNIGSPLPVGLPLPVPGVAVAEEATSTSVNPAGIGFLHGPALEYFHMEGDVADGDGLYAAGLIGPFGPALSVEWVRPAAGPRYRLTTLGLALSDGHTASLGFAWRWWSSPDAAIDPMHAWDVGLTLRPWRQLSIGASALGIDSRYQGQTLPVQYDLGLGLRFLDDSVTLSGDVLANDRAGHDFDVTGGAVGLAVELKSGLAFSAQYRFPVGSSGAQPAQHESAGIVSVTWNGHHAGVTAGAMQATDDSRWLAGARVSRERYPSTPRADRGARASTWPASSRRTASSSSTSPASDPFDDLLRRLSEAGDDSAVGAVVLEIDELPLGAGRTEELRAAIARGCASASRCWPT